MDIVVLSKMDPAVRQAATDAITILVRAGENFNGADLRGIRIPGADLTEGQFESTQFQGADLTGTKLTRTWRISRTLEWIMSGLERTLMRKFLGYAPLHPRQMGRCSPIARKWQDQRLRVSRMAASLHFHGPYESGRVCDIFS